MAKFYDLHLLLQNEQRIMFGDDSLGKDGPAQYPATNLGSEKPFIEYTTISGYNTTYPGMGVSSTAAIDELVVSVPLAGERATKDYHLVRYDQLLDVVFDEANSDWQDSVLTMTSGTPPASPGDGDRYIVDTPGTGAWTGLEDSIVEWNTASGTWDVYTPNEGYTTFVEDEDKYYVYYNGAWAPMGEGIDHGDLIGLGDDDHPQYVPTDGSRGFTSTVSGVEPVAGYDLVTKDYLDAVISSISGTTTIISGVIYISHSGTIGRDDPDQHPGSAISLDTTNFNGILSGLDVDVQTAMDTIDDALTSNANFVTISGTPQTITSDKTFDGTLTTFLNDVFFNGIEITMSGTTLNTEAGAVFNYDSTATINNDATNNFTDNASITTSGTDIDFGDGTTINYEDGSVSTYEDGSVVNHESGSTENHEATSVDNYEDGSTINNDGDTNYGSTATITTSGTDIDYGDGTTVNFEDGSTETYEGGSETFHNSGSVDTYLPGSIVTFSGSDVNFDGDTDINYGPDTTTVNEGDTTYPAGSSTTFSGTTCFESDINFGCTTTSGLTMDFGDNTISGTGNIYAGNLHVEELIDESKKWGREAMLDGVRQQTVTFGTAFPSDDYTVVTAITNEVDAKPSIYSATVGPKTASGFLVYFSGKIDSSDYELEWHAFKGEMND